MSMKETFTTMEVFILFNAERGFEGNHSSFVKIANQDIEQYLKGYERLVRDGYIDVLHNLTQKGVDLVHGNFSVSS